MTTTEATTVSPPASYPTGEWIEDPEDYFWVPANLRQWYADPAAAPSKHQRQRLRQNEPMPGGGPVRVDRIILTNGRHTKAPAIKMGQTESRGLLGPYRAALVTVDPDADPDDMAHKTWEHGIRLEAAQRAADVDATYEHHYRTALARACGICGTQNQPGAIGLNPSGAVGFVSFMGQPFCGRCLPAVQLAAAQRHQQQYQQRIDNWLDDHLPAHTPRPPERSQSTVSQRW